MARVEMKITVKRAWWVLPYLYTVVWFSEVTGLLPDLDRLVAFAQRGYSVEVN
jgi:hypothetical protein